MFDLHLTLRVGSILQLTTALNLSTNKLRVFGSVFGIWFLNTQINRKYLVSHFLLLQLVFWTQATQELTDMLHASILLCYAIAVYHVTHDMLVPVHKSQKLLLRGNTSYRTREAFCHTLHESIHRHHYDYVVRNQCLFEVCKVVWQIQHVSHAIGLLQLKSIYILWKIFEIHQPLCDFQIRFITKGVNILQMPNEHIYLEFILPL